MKLLKRVLKWITAAVVVLLVIAFLVGFIAYWRSTNDCGKTGQSTNPMKAIVYAIMVWPISSWRRSKSLLPVTTRF